MYKKIFPQQLLQRLRRAGHAPEESPLESVTASISRFSGRPAMTGSTVIQLMNKVDDDVAMVYQTDLQKYTTDSCHHHDTILDIDIQNLPYH